MSILLRVPLPLQPQMVTRGLCPVLHSIAYGVSREIPEGGRLGAAIGGEV